MFSARVSFRSSSGVAPLVGNPLAVYTESELAATDTVATLRQCKSVIGITQMLHVVHVVEPGDVVSNDLMLGGALENISKRDVDDLVPIPQNDPLLVWVTAGSRRTDTCFLIECSPLNSLSTS